MIDGTYSNRSSSIPSPLRISNWMTAGPYACPFPQNHVQSIDKSACQTSGSRAQKRRHFLFQTRNGHVQGIMHCPESYLILLTVINDFTVNKQVENTLSCSEKWLQRWRNIFRSNVRPPWSTESRGRRYWRSTSYSPWGGTWGSFPRLFTRHISIVRIPILNVEGIRSGISC